MSMSTISSSEKLSEGYDRKKKCHVVDVKKLCRVLVKIIKQADKAGDDTGLVIDSHLSHYISPRYVDACLVTKCNLKLLSRRLKRRKYGEAKVRENLDCEIFDVCYNEAAEAGHNIIVVETDSKVEYDKLVRKIRRKKIKK